MSGTLADGMIGLAVGDALGVPVEFSTRQERDADPVTGMRAGGTYRQPAGTWSDDTSMAFALADALGRGLDYRAVMQAFCDWKFRNKYTARGQVFDCGSATSDALCKFEYEHLDPLSCGMPSPRDGNGSLMRTLPAAGWLYSRYGADLDADAPMEVIHNLSALTHASTVCRMGCGIYCCIAAQLLAGADLTAAIYHGTERAFRYYKARGPFRQEMRTYDRIWDPGTLKHLDRGEILSSGYIVYTLEAALWCCLTTDSYADCVLRAVNLGDDTDTVAAVAGGLAGIACGQEGIPAGWVSQIPKAEALRAAADRCCRTGLK